MVLLQRGSREKPYNTRTGVQHHAYTSFSKAHHYGEQQTPSKFQKNQGSFKSVGQSFGSKDWSQNSKNSLSQSQSHMGTPVRETRDTTKLEDGSFETNLGPSYSAIYIGLVLVALGLVISFVGLGEKGFKTTELKLIGPVLCIIGFSCIILKIIQCNFPRLFEYSSYFKKAKKKVDQSTSVEKGLPNGTLKASSNKSTPQILSPRVTLHSSKKSPRPRSTIPNYIEDSSDEDDFDPGRSKPHTNRLSSFEQHRKHPEEQPPQQNEIVLNPKSLML
ncbi:unnamed protein product [Allacma fusca]|uniref:Uncharacterized protein n=1 Tax=Allacma fusca TaxID=39272 RepID=A0A8J2JBS0_9HEXA|nr:unnamed protein product [Allacma fusca]